MTEPIAPEHLRFAALEALGSHGDERAKDAIAFGELTIESRSTWESSAGTVRGHMVRLGVSAAILARVHQAPAVEDALHAAIAAGFATVGTSDALAELALCWLPSPRMASAAYRGPVPAPSQASPPSLHAALREYLAALGEADAAEIAAHSTLETSENTVTLRLAARDVEAAATVKLERAIHAMLGPRMTVVFVPGDAHLG